jgi:hypothetical protein
MPLARTAASVHRALPAVNGHLLYHLRGVSRLAGRGAPRRGPYGPEHLLPRVSAGVAGEVLQAGEKAVARSAHHEAVMYFEQALRALSHLPKTRDTREQAIDLRLALRSALLPCSARPVV